MNSNLLSALHIWIATGWTILHLLWVGTVIGLMAALVRRLSKTARPETQYGVALMFLLVLSVSPILIFAEIFQPDSGSPNTKLLSATEVSASLASSAKVERRPTMSQAVRDGAPTRSWLESLVTLLPWIWLCGSLSTLIMLALGLIGVEQMRRTSRLEESVELLRRCHARANSLGIARRVSLGICDRLAMPLLIGIVRPLILLPSVALNGWSVEQLEMVLLHELAHLKRWDNLVTLIQRLVESVLFFHPVVWWLSSWVRLERELCCDELVVEQLGRPIAYAEMLATLSGSSHRNRRLVLAMADRQVLTRIRRLLNLEERSMKLTMPEGLGLLGAMVLAMSLALGLPAAQLAPVSGSNEKSQQVPVTADDEVKDIPVLEVRPRSEPLSLKDTNATSRRLKSIEPKNPLHDHPFSPGRATVADSATTGQQRWSDYLSLPGRHHFRLQCAEVRKDPVRSR